VAIMTVSIGVAQIGPSTSPLRIRLRSLDSAGELGVVELEMTPGSEGPPLHVHPTHSEGFYVLAGLPTFQVGADLVTGGPGTWVFAPRNAAHALANHGSETARLLCVFAPGGFERRFERMLAEQAGLEIAAEIAELAEAERSTRVVGPPIPRTAQPNTQ
jgi:quercetin dioxygenase-like cupin family protein